MSLGSASILTGRRWVIGSPAFDINPGTSSDIDYAAAYVYERDRDRFIFKQKLQGVPIPANPGGLSHFGLTTVLNEQPSERPAFGLRAASTRAQWPHSASLPNYTRRSRSRSQSVIRSILDAIPHWTASTRTLSWVLSGDALRDFGD
jgi:hypothetical protein